MSGTTDALRRADPDLKIIPAGRRKRDRDTQGYDDCNGVVCPECRQEVFRIVNGHCPKCEARITMQNERAMEKIAMALTYMPKNRKRKHP